MMLHFAKMEWLWYPSNFDKICINYGNSLIVLHPLNSAKNKHILILTAYLNI